MSKEERKAMLEQESDDTSVVIGRSFTAFTYNGWIIFRAADETEEECLRRLGVK